MSRRSRKLLYFGSSAGIGLTYHLTIASKYFSKTDGLDFTLISGHREQFNGLFKILEKNNIQCVTFEGIDEIKNFFKTIIPFLKYVKKERFDIIHVQTNTQLIYAILSKILYKTKMMYTIHSHRHGKPVKSMFISAALSFVLNLLSDNVIALSSLEKKYFNKFSLETVFLPLGFENRHALKISKNDAINIVYPAVFQKRKGHLWLIESIIPLMEKYSDINMCLPGAGKVLDSCKRLVKDKELRERIIFPGWLNKEKLDKYMAWANLVIVSSKSETFGHCIVEPMFYGLPVITTPVGIAPDVVKDGYNGFIVKHGDKDALREKILYFYKNRNKLREFGKRSYEIARKELTWDVIAKKYAKLLYEL